MGTPGSYKLRETDMETGVSTDFPCTGDPFEGLDDKPKKLFQYCQDLKQTSIEAIEAFLETSEEVTLKQTDKNGINVDCCCRDLNQSSIKVIEAFLETFEEVTLKQTDKNGMNVFHVLLFEKENSPDWFAKNLDSESRAKVVSIIKSICKKFSKQVIGQLMKQQDNNQRTPLHYAAITDIDGEPEESNITLALLLHGADKALFQKGQSEKCWEPVRFICTSTLSTLFDTKHENDGPVGHPERVAHCDISTLRPENFEKKSKDSEEKTENSKKKSKNPLSLDYIRILAMRHSDLFDHQVLSALIW